MIEPLARAAVELFSFLRRARRLPDAARPQRRGARRVRPRHRARQHLGRSGPHPDASRPPDARQRAEGREGGEVTSSPFGHIAFAMPNMTHVDLWASSRRIADVMLIVRSFGQPHERRCCAASTWAAKSMRRPAIQKDEAMTAAAQTLSRRRKFSALSTDCPFVYWSSTLMEQAMSMLRRYCRFSIRVLTNFRLLCGLRSTALGRFLSNRLVHGVRRPRQARVRGRSSRRRWTGWAMVRAKRWHAPGDHHARLHRALRDLADLDPGCNPA